MSARPTARRRTGRAPAIPLTADLAQHIRRIIKERGLTQMQAAQILGITQPNLVTCLRHIPPRCFALPRLLQFLNLLGHDVHIIVTPQSGVHAGHSLTVNKLRGAISLTLNARPHPAFTPDTLFNPPGHRSPAAVPFALDLSGLVPLKARLANFICATLDRRGITRLEAAVLFDTCRQHVSDLYHFLPKKFAVQRLLQFLNLLGHDVHIIVRPAAKPRGELLLTLPD